MHEKLHDRSADSDFAIDDNGHCIYWDAVSRSIKTLEPAQIIYDPYIFIGKIGQQNLLPNHFKLRPKDLEITYFKDKDGLIHGAPILPGISSFLFFGTKMSDQHTIEHIAQKHLGRDVRPKNRLYVAQIEHIESAGWVPFFVPLIHGNTRIYNPLHVVLIPSSIYNSGEMKDANAAERETIASVFIRWP